MPQLCVVLTILNVWWPLRFFPETDFIYNYLHIVQKWTQTERGNLKKASRFLSTGHRILPSCDSMARETMVAKFELAQSLKNLTSWLNSKNILVQRPNCNISRFSDTVASLANEARFFTFRVFFKACSLQKEVGEPPFFCLFSKSRSLPFCVASIKIICAWEHLGAYLLKENLANFKPSIRVAHSTDLFFVGDISVINWMALTKSWRQPCRRATWRRRR